MISPAFADNIYGERGGTSQIRLGSYLADLMTDPFVFSPDMSQENRVVLLTDIIALQRAIRQMGWHEHTGDWDWFCYVTLLDGSTLECDDGLHLLMSGTTPDVLPVQADDNFTACVDYPRVTHLLVELYPEDESDCRTTRIPLNDIAQLQITEA